jgi:hypothetical protein
MHYAANPSLWDELWMFIPADALPEPLCLVASDPRGGLALARFMVETWGACDAFFVRTLETVRERGRGKVGRAVEKAHGPAAADFVSELLGGGGAYIHSPTTLLRIYRNRRLPVEVEEARRAGRRMRQVAQRWALSVHQVERIARKAARKAAA